MAFFGPPELAETYDGVNRGCERPEFSFCLSHNWDNTQACKIYIYKDLFWAEAYISSHLETSHHIGLVHRVNFMQMVAFFLESEFKGHLYLIQTVADPVTGMFKASVVLRQPNGADSSRLIVEYIDNRFFTLHHTQHQQKLLPGVDYSSLNELLDAVREFAA
jgi:hypothetical protein